MRGKPQADFRASLAARCRLAPGRLGAAAAAAGVSGADAFLCHLSRSIANSLECLAAFAEVARTRIQAVRDAARAEDHFRCDEIEASFADAEIKKQVALERERCLVDDVLEKLRTSRAAAAEASESVADAEIVVQYADLAARLDAADAQLLALPTTFVEPP